MSDQFVYLECVKVGSKLRVRIVSDGYNKDANCMFPRDLRIAGRKFKTHRWNVTLITTRGKYYYTISKSGIEILPDVLDPSQLKIFEDTSTDECAICMENPKCAILNPCGHYYMCETCAQAVKECPICRGKIGTIIHKSQMD